MLDLSEKDIENICDFMVGMEILRDRNLINDSIFDVDDIREILRLKYHPKTVEEPMDSQKNLIFNNYSNIMLKLKEQLVNVKNLINCFDFQREFGELYRISEIRIKEKMNKLKELIDKKRFPILTAGEANAGKSTLVNLLLGYDLMPMGLTTCTRMICEVRNSNEKIATFIMDEGDKSKNHVVSLATNATEEISRLVRQEDEMQYKKAIFEYPVSFLDRFTYLVDSPGIGDTSALDKVTFGFLNESCPAFIFVLNATNACGLTITARLLITKAREELNKEYSCFMADELGSKENKYSTNQIDKAIFILNHWDIIKRNVECKDTMNSFRASIVRDIRQLWDDSVNEATQIFFFSAKQAREWSEKGVIQTELTNLRKSLINLVSKVYERNFQNCLGALSDILDYVERIILCKINTNVDSKYSRLYNKEHTEKLCEILETISKNSAERKQSIIQSLKPQVNMMIKSLTNHLKTDDFRNKILMSFKKVMDKNKNVKQKSLQCNNFFPFKTKPPEKANDDKSTEHENVDIVTNILKKILEKKIFKELQNWELKSKEIENLNTRLNNLFEEQINQISNDIRLENVFISKSSLMGAWKNIDQTRIKPLENEIISKVEQIFIFSTITLLFPVVAMAGILATPLVIHHYFQSKKSLEDRQKQYDIDEDEYLRSLIFVSIENISEDYVRKQFFTGMLQQCMEHINGFDEFIKLELSEKQQLIRDIEKENREFPDVLRSLNVLLRIIEKCYGDYHLLRNRFLPDPTLTRRSSFYLGDDDSSPQIDELVSLCQSSVVFRSRRNKNVLFKMYNKSFIQQFARFQMQEIDLLSIGPFQCILRLKHMCYLDREEKLLLVLEDVDCNLYTFVNENRDLIPVTFNRGTPSWTRAMNFVIDVSKKLCVCLEVLHGFDVRMVHPDLRIDTILVSKTDIQDVINVFICDACTNLPTQREQQSCDNVPSEVADLTFDMGGYTLENIYRLGIIFYELAYFSCKYRSQSQSISSFEEDFDRTNSVFGSIDSIESDVLIDWNHPQHSTLPSEFNNLIKRCLSTRPQDRPSAKECLARLSDIKL